MQAREHSSGWNAGAWQQVSLSFSTRVAGEAQRLAGRIRRQLADGLLGQWHRPRLPLWSPDYSAFIGAMWAERLVSRVYDTLSSLVAVPRDMPSFDWKPGRLVWFRPGPAGAVPWSEEEDAGADAPVHSGVADVAPGGVRPVEYGAPADAGGFAEARARPRRRRRTAPLTGTGRFSPGTPLLRMGPWGRALAEGGRSVADMLTFHPHRALAAGGIETGLAAEDASVDGVELTPPAARVEPRGAARRGPLRPPITAGRPTPAPYPGLVHRALAAVERTREFSGRILAGPMKEWPGEGVTPPALPDGAPAGAPWSAAKAAANVAGSDAGALRPGERIGLTGAVPLARWERYRSRATHAGQASGMPLAQQRGLLDEATPGEPARSGAGAGVPPATPRRAAAGLRYGRSEMVVPPLEVALASMPAAEPPIEAYPTAEALVSVAGRDAGRREEAAIAGWEMPDGDRAASAAPSAVDAVGAGRPSHASGAGYGVAFALAGRSAAGEEAPSSGEAAGVTEDEEEGGEVNMDRLARDVYVILKRRLAWERERSLASRA